MSISNGGVGSVVLCVCNENCVGMCFLLFLVYLLRLKFMFFGLML